MIKRIISLILTLSMMLSLGGMAAYASSTDSTENGITVTGDTAFSMRGEQAPSDVKAFIESYGITVADNALIEYRPAATPLHNSAGASAFSAETNESGPMLIVTTLNGSEVQQNYLIGVGEQDSSPVGVSDGKTVSIWNFNITLNMVASFSFVWVGSSLCVKPERLYIQYYKNDGNTVNKIAAQFATDGALLEYPSGRELGLYTHHIDVSKSSPVAGQSYSNINNSIPSDRCIKVMVMNIMYSVTVNGTDYTGNSEIFYLNIARELGLIY